MAGLAIACKGCARAIPANDVNLESGLAKCRSCHAVFPFSDQRKPALRL